MSKQDIMYSEIELFFASGLTQREFVKGKDYTKDSFHYWLTKYRLEKKTLPSEDQEKVFHEIDLSKAPNTSVKLLELTTRSGVHIIIYH
jgi:hypothetical protein